MAKILNIDSLAKAERVLTLGGKDYAVEDMTVENFIATTQEANKLKDEPDGMKQMNATVDMIMRSIPTIEREVLMKVALKNLMVILRFTRGELDDPQDTPAAPVTEGGAEKK